MRVLILDNYDSFVWNIADYVGRLGAEPLVVRSTKTTLEKIYELNPDRVIISPGPGHPSERRFTGVSHEVVAEVSRDVPTLGICLGMQLMAHVFGGSVIKAKRIVHGKQSKIVHDGKGLFKNVENPMTVGRYHSLVVAEERMPDVFEVVAKTVEDDEVMAIRHRSRPLAGVQFHPESILTPNGITIIMNFLRGEL